MAIVQLLPFEHVGTTYKRALERFHHSRDAEVPRHFNVLRLIEPSDNWSVRPMQQKGRTMRKPRDFDAELKALNDKARQLRDRKRDQLGELVIATGADVLPIEALAGALIAAAETKEAAIKEGWRKRGAAFFQQSRRNAGGPDRCAGGGATNDGHTKPPAGAPGA